MRLSWRRLTAAQLNGLSVALGVALVQALASTVFGAEVGLATAGGAVCASLTDVPNPPQRVLRRLVPAALLGAVVTLSVGLLRESPLAMTALIALTAFVTLMTMAWGPRAGPLSFSGVLALVFAMAWEDPLTRIEAVQHAGWVLLGASCYALWARSTAWLLRRRYRDLALVAAMQASARRLRSRAARIAGELLPEGDSMRASIRDDVELADALQAARDQVFAARPSASSRRQVDLVLGLIELRDLLLASRLDIPLLGEDGPGMAWRGALAATLRQLAQALDGLAEAVAAGTVSAPFSALAWRAELTQRLAQVPVPENEPRRHLLAALQSRLSHMLDDVAQMVERASGPDRPASLAPEQLQQFVSPEGWPLAALKPHASLQSGVLRHAVRGMLAMSCAYVLGLILPWAAHPHWLVLSVAVVLRGNLEQTLSRRNERIIGTVIGCLVVLGLAQVRSHAVLAFAFIAAVGTAHAYVNVRYRVAATAATLMALLQPLLLAPGSSPAVGERLADTVLGALLAWAFCFVLPAWERRSLGRLSVLLCEALARHASNVLRWAPDASQQLAQRLSRQQAYAALAALAAAGQRTRVEPAHVRVPETHVEALLTHGYRLMALLGAVQTLLNRRAQRLDEGQTRPALQASAQHCVALLRPGGLAGPWPTVPAMPGDDEHWPEHRDDVSLTPWLLRRLRLCEREAGWLVAAVHRLQTDLKPKESP